MAMQAIARRMNSSGSDSKFFTTTKKGEIHELRQDLSHQSRDKKKDAVKKVIANMTVGKDVSMLFTDVVNCMQTANTQLKKLVYLYLINYAKSNPDLAILAVNTFVKDANDPNPLIRALAVRTMGCIRVDRITEYLCEPLRRCLQDEDPYVRKTAAICVAKLYDINPDLVEEQGFLDALKDLISDSNPTVVANAVAALSEIVESGGKDLFKITKSTLQKLLAALNECTEWGQVFVLDALSQYNASDSREAEGIIERVSPRLQHANSAVVLSAIRVIMKNLEKVKNQDTVRALSRKMAPPLVTLLSTEPEIQYVALRNINLIVQKRPNVLAHEIKVFFCKYNDPIYVKMEKLEIIIRLVSERNIEQVLLELKEYATEVDVDFVRRSVRAIGRCAIKLERAAERCINVLLELIQTKVNYIVQEAIIVIKDIFRKYPNQYESIIATLCENLETLDEPEAKAAMIWIIGEYAERIDNADELLEVFLSGFQDETTIVQLQLLTATVKLFLKRPNGTQDMVQKVLNMATEDSDNPDLRDRGYVYWRLLSANPEAAKCVVLAEKPTISDDTNALETNLLDDLIANVSTLASVYHKLPESFVSRSVLQDSRENDNDEDDQADDDYDDEEEEEKSTERSSGTTSSGAVDLLDMGGLSMDETPTSSSVPVSISGSQNPLEDFFGATTSTPAPVQAKPVLVGPDQGKGSVLHGLAVYRDGKMYLDIDVENTGSTPTAGFAVQFNKSTFGVVSTQPTFSFSSEIQPGMKGSYSLPLGVNPSFVNTSAEPSLNVQAAIKNQSSGEVIYFQFSVDFPVLLSENGSLEKSDFITKWKAVDEANEKYSVLNSVSTTDVDALIAKLAQKRVYYVAKRSIGSQQEVVYCSLKTCTNVLVLMEITFQVGSNGCKLCVKTNNAALAPLFQKNIELLLEQ